MARFQKFIVVSIRFFNLRFSLVAFFFAFMISCLTAFAPGAEACETEQLQFFGVVKKVHQMRVARGGNYCTYEIELLAVPVPPAPDTVCPLPPEDVPGLLIRDLTCSKVVGQKINGVIVRSGRWAWVD